MQNVGDLITLAASIDTSSDLYSNIMYMISRRTDVAGSVMSNLYWDAQRMEDMKAHVAKVDTYLTKANASDETIILLTEQNNEYKKIISDYDTAFTHVANEPGASANEVKAMFSKLLLASAS